MHSDNSDLDVTAADTRAAYLFCDICMHYPMEPVHGHYYCPSCHNATKCCEIGPMTLEAII